MARTTYFANDFEILNYALTLEYLEADFYTKVVRDHAGVLSAAELATFTVIRDHELAHVAALRDGIIAAGGTPVKARQSYDYSPIGDINMRAGILKIAGTLEPTGVGAYDGAAAEIKNKAYLVVAGQIVQVEARHAATIREIIDPNANPVPMAYEQTLRRPQVEAAVAPLLGPTQP
jgi:hypothetical protein